MLQRGRQGDSRGDLGADGGVSAEGLPDRGAVGREAQAILRVLAGTGYATRLINHIDAAPMNSSATYAASRKFDSEYRENFSPHAPAKCS